MFLRFLALSGSSQLPAASCQFLCSAATESLSPAKRFLKSSKTLVRCQWLRPGQPFFTGNWPLATGN
jgi:hypothetical protein